MSGPWTAHRAPRLPRVSSPAPSTHGRHVVVSSPAMPLMHHVSTPDSPVTSNFPLHPIGCYFAPLRNPENNGGKRHATKPQTGSCRTFLCTRCAGSAHHCIRQGQGPRRGGDPRVLCTRAVGGRGACSQAPNPSLAVVVADVTALEAPCER